MPMPMGARATTNRKIKKEIEAEKRAHKEAEKHKKDAAKAHKRAEKEKARAHKLAEKHKKEATATRRKNVAAIKKRAAHPLHGKSWKEVAKMHK